MEPLLSLPEVLVRCRIMPVIVSNEPAIAEPLARALAMGGLAVGEITLRTQNALALLREFAATGIVTGAGTVTSAEQAEAAIAAGAHFLVTPGYSAAVNHVASEANVPVLPGVATATEMMRAVDDGHGLVKFFPAMANGGPSVLRALATPLAALAFVPTGGITQDNAISWFAVPSVVALGGSWMVPTELLESANFAEVTRLSRAASVLAQLSRTNG